MPIVAHAKEWNGNGNGMEIELNGSVHINLMCTCNLNGSVHVGIQSYK